MAYQTGTVNSLADIQTVIRTFLVGNGWTWDAGSSTIYKDDVFVTFVAPSGDKVLFQAKTALSGGSSAPAQAGVGRMVHDRVGNVPAVITYPATYWAFLADDEFYFVIGYDVTRYQFVTWGKSTLEVGVGATGMFISGTINNQAPSTSVSGLACAIWITPSTGGSTFWYGTRSGAAFWQTTAEVSSGINLNCDQVHTTLDGSSWDLSDGSALTRAWVGAGAFGNLMSVLPSGWNSESPLLPIRAYKRRPESKVSLVLDLQHARYCRVDNFADREIVTIGPDQWQVFPFHRRNMSARNGGTSLGHTGTFGWAIRKVD